MAGSAAMQAPYVFVSMNYLLIGTLIIAQSPDAPQSLFYFIHYIPIQFLQNTQVLATYRVTPTYAPGIPSDISNPPPELNSGNPKNIRAIRLSLKSQNSED
ncbi:MAG: hypothetical protein DRP85_08050 [Candidatus Makaraimicrobium thalassicum]|nr:MAG: hypothetical protein DRP85_08050 [Candidatus Omnitrophota bacterium]